MAEGISQNDSSKENSRLGEFLSNKINLAVVGLLFVGLFLLAFGAGMFLLRGSSKDDIKIISSEESASSKAGEIIVHVDGAVKNPGIYKLAADSRVNDAVVAAGGLSQDADSARINLAAKLSDGTKVYIPSHNDPVSSGSAGSVAGEVAASLININTATEAQLDSLPSIGPVTAQKIIASRPYSAKEELLSKKAVGSATYDKIKDLITVY